MGRSGRLLAVLLGLLAVLATAAPSGAQPEDDERLRVRSIDGRNPDAVEIEFFYDGPRETVPDLVVRENGEIIDHTDVVRLDDTEAFGIVLAIDTSGSMNENNGFERALDAARTFIENKDDDDQIAIVGFAETAQIVQRFTADTETLLEAVDRLGIAAGTALYDAVRDSVNLFQDTPLVPNIVVLTDGGDVSSDTSPEIARGLLDESSALLFAIGIDSGDLDEGALRDLAEPTGGALLTADSTGDLANLYSDVQQRLRRQYRTTIVSETTERGPAALQLTIGTISSDASFTPGARLDAASQVEPVVVPDRGGVSALQSGVFVWVAVVLILLAVAAAVWAIATSIVRDNPRLDRVLQPYSDGFVAPEDEDSDRMATSAILQRAVELTEGIARRRGFLQRCEDALERANLPLRAAEGIFFWAVATVLLAIAGWALAGNVLGGVLLALLALFIPPAIVAYLARKRRNEFHEQLPDMLQLLASTLRSGYSLMQGVEAAAQEVRDPMRRELQRVVTEARLGMPLVEAFENVAARFASRDFEWATMAISIQREVGGNLAELLDTVADTMTQRERLRRDISALTAEGRVSAMVLGFLPIGIGAAIFALNPTYMDNLFEETIGLIMLIGAGILMGFGFWWMYKIIDIEV